MQDIPLADLQSLGERYAPRVLREYLSTHGYASSSPSIRVHMDLPETFSTSKLEILRLLISSHIFSSIFIIVGFVLFSNNQSFWQNIDNLPLQQAVIASAVPSGLAAVALVLGFTTSVAGEYMGFKPLVGSKLNVRELVGGIGGVLNRISLIFDLIFLLVFFKTSLIGTFIFYIFLLLVLLLPIVRPRSVEWVSWWTNYGFVFTRYSIKFVPLSDQTGNLLETSVRSFTTCFGIHMLMLPIKIFFILDFGSNWILIASLWTRILGSLLDCLVIVVPTYKPLFSDNP